MAIDALIASEVFYLLSISQFLPSLRARLQGKPKPVAYASAIGILSVIILQFLFSQWNDMNQWFDTAPQAFTQMLICVVTELPVVVLTFILQRFDPFN